MKTILSIDGGGVGGVIPAYLIMQKYGEDFRPAQGFDLIAGTSAGALLAGLYAVGCSTKDAYDIFADEIKNVFQKNFLWKFRPGCTKYPSEPIDSALDRHIGALEMRRAACELVIPAQSLRRRRGTYFKKWKHGKLKMRDAVRASMAAPTYFEPARFLVPCGESTIGADFWMMDAFTDGGLFANDPAAVAYVEARKFLGWSQEPLVIQSFGTGQSETLLGEGAAAVPSLVLTQAARAFEDLLSNATDNVARFMAVFSEHDERLAYYRYNPIVEDYALDDVNAVGRLVDAAQDYFMNKT